MVRSKEEAYILGLWCADGYHRTSSIGLSNVDYVLITRFADYLKTLYSDERLRLRVYIPCHCRISQSKIDGFEKITYSKVRKAKHISYHVYVNSRPLLRKFREQRESLINMNKDLILPYIAGRFDGDGSIAKDYRRDFRISYGNTHEAAIDKSLLEKIGFYQVKVYRYKKAKTYVVYVSRNISKDLIKSIKPYSSKLLHPVETEGIIPK